MHRMQVRASFHHPIISLPELNSAIRAPVDSGVRAFGCLFHKACFVCSVCGLALGNDGYHDESSGKVMHLLCSNKT